MIKTAIILAIIGHILCGVCDALLTYTPNGKLGVKDAKDPAGIIRNRAVKGGPQHNEMQIMFANARNVLNANITWQKNAENKVKNAEIKLNNDFIRLLR
jgi:hypothetical protein